MKARGVRYFASASLPPLAWCAEVRRDGVHVRHGLGVEVGGDSFCEGAWDGPFAARGFIEASTFAGSGGRVRDDGIELATPSHLTERLYVIRTRPSVWVSNSLVFVLTAADDGFARGYPHVHRDFLALHRNGLTRRDLAWLPTRKGRVACHVMTNLVVDYDLRVRLVPKAEAPAPTCFDDYVATLEATVARVLANAADPARTRSYAPIATLSSGYDSAAVATLGARLGLRDAVTLAGPDSGAAIADHLGLDLRQRTPDIAALHVAQWAEHCCFDRGYSTRLGCLEHDLVGRIVLTGYSGDSVWGTRPIAPGLVRHDGDHVAGTSLIEQRLRAGFMHFPVATIHGHDTAAIHRVTQAPEMDPYRVGGDYDRPIARRIVESAGVPRGAFALEKRKAHIANPWRPFDLTLPAHAALQDAYGAAAASFAERQRIRLGHRLYRWESQLLALASRLGRVLPRRVPERYRVRPSLIDYSAHWAIDTLRARYR